VGGGLRGGRLREGKGSGWESSGIKERAYQQQYPALRFAHRVRAMTPLFCAKVDMGVMVMRVASIPLSPSARMPPWMRESNTSPSTSSWETGGVIVSRVLRVAGLEGKIGGREVGICLPSQVAVMSPIASHAQIMKMVIIGSTSGP